METKNQNDEININKPDLALALEPFGYQRDPITGKRSTTLRYLPGILKNFQDSRQTLYFPDSVIEALRNSPQILQDPDKLIGDEELEIFFETARQDIQSSSPMLNSQFNSSKNNQQEEDNQSFNSQHIPIISSTPKTKSNSSTLNSSIRSERHRSLPLDYPDTHLRRPKPPHRRKRASNTTDLLQNSINSSDLNHSINTSTFSSPILSQDKDSIDHQVIQSPSPSPKPNISTFNQFNTCLLTPDNLSSLIFKNRQLGLYDSTEDNYQFQPQSSSPPDSQDDNPNDILNRLRSDITSRPDSKVFTRVFESSDIEEFQNQLREQEDETLQTNSEDYSNLIKTCEAYKIKNKELKNQISNLEKIHEDEIVKLSDQLEEIGQELSTCKKSEKDLSNMTSKLSFQLSNSDDQMARMNKNYILQTENYQKMKQKWDEAVSESEKLRIELKLRNEELRSANHSIESHASDIKKYESDQLLREEHIKKLKVELEELQTTRSILEEQKQANLELKATIDKLKFELEEQRMRNAGSSVAGSRPTSIVGSINQRLGEEFKKVIASGDFEKNDEEDDDSGTETTGGDETEDFERIVHNFPDAGLTSNHSDIFDEIRITRYSRRQNSTRDNENGQVIELCNAQTNTDDLLSFKSKNIQTDPVPEPSPVYLPKMEEIQVQTEESFSLDQSSNKALIQLVNGIDPNVLKLAIDHIHQQQMIETNHRTQQSDTIQSASTSDISDEDSQNSSSDESEEEDENYIQKLSSTLSFPSYLSSWSLYRIHSILSPYWIFNSLPSFGLLKKNKNQQESIIVDEDKQKSKNRRNKKKLSTKGIEFNNNNKKKKEGKLQKNIRICTVTMIILATGYYWGHLIFPSNLIGDNDQNNKTSILKCKNSSLIQYPTSLEKIIWTIGNNNNINNQSNKINNFNQTCFYNNNLIDHLSFIHLKKVGLDHLADFNSIGIGHEGFFLQIKNQFQLFLWLKDLGTNFLWNSVGRNQKTPT